MRLLSSLFPFMCIEILLGKCWYTKFVTKKGSCIRVYSKFTVIFHPQSFKVFIKLSRTSDPLGTYFRTRNISIEPIRVPDSIRECWHFELPLSQYWAFNMTISDQAREKEGRNIPINCLPGAPVCSQNIKTPLSSTPQTVKEKNSLINLAVVISVSWEVYLIKPSLDINRLWHCKPICEKLLR